MPQAELVKGGTTRVKHVFRYDLSALFPRLHDAFKGLAVPDAESRRVVITDVPRNYELPLRAALRSPGRSCVRQPGQLMINTGLWLCDFTKPWVEQAYFEIRDPR